MATSNEVAADGPADVLVTLYPAPRRMEWEERLRHRCPGAGKLEVRFATTNKPDGTPVKPSEQDPRLFENATMLFSYLPAPAELVPKLRFVQVSSAGTDLWANHPKYLDREVTFCTTSGSSAPQIAEWVIGSWLRFRNDFPRYEEQQKQCTWKPATLDAWMADSMGARVGILGYGAIGRQVARVCKAMGMDIVAFTSTPRLTPESRRDRAFCAPGLGDPEGTLPSQWFHGKTKDDLDNFLAQNLDMLVISLPLTKATEKFISKEQFDILSAKRTFVVNIARGPIVDTEALVEALEQDKIRGAAVDVTDPEPLPEDHPLWKAKNCLITPHVSWQSTSQFARVLDILALNLEQFYNGEQLLNELKR